MSDIDNIIYQAQEIVNEFVFLHRQAAIPTLIAVCVQWEVIHGGTDIVKGTLQRAMEMADEMNAETKRN